MPDHASDPPHCSASVSSDAGHGSRRAAFTAASIPLTIARPRSSVRRVPPVVWMFIVCRSGPVSSPSRATVAPIWLTSQPRPTISTPPTFG